MFEALKKQLAAFSGPRAAPLTLQTGQVFLTRASGLLLSLGLNLALTRWLGITSYGTYSYILSWVAILTIPSTGLEVLVVREIAIARRQEHPSALGGLIRWSLRNTLFVGCVLALAGALAVSLLPIEAREMRIAFLIGLAGVPLLCLQIFSGAIFRGFRRVEMSVLLNEIVQPALLLLWIGLCLFADVQASASAAFAGRLIALVLILFLFLFFSFKLDLRWPWPAATGEQTAVWRKGVYSLALLRGIDTVVIRLPVLILGLMIGPVSVALYSLSARIAETVVFTFSIVSLTIGPYVAEFHAKRDYAGMQQLVTRSTRAISAWAILIALALILSGRWILGWFGPQFAAGYPILLVLIAGKTVDAITGNVGLVMTMGGLERVVARTRALGLALTAILCFMLIPRWGAMGGAIGYTAALIFYNIVLVVQLYRRLGISTFIFGRSRHNFRIP